MTQARAWGRPRWQGNPFSLGLASGDPTDDGVVLWTRLAPDPLGGGGMPPLRVPVRWELARDERFRHVVRRGYAWATPELAHSVHVEVDDLQADREYFYRFKAGGEVSPVARTRTAPRDGHGTGSYRFAFVSCQSWEDGYYTAYRHLADEDIAAILHLGDYIYESVPDPDAVRTHDGAGEPITLEQYRNRHALYKTDLDLQLAHATHPFISTIDDHEVDSDWRSSFPQDPDLQPPAAWEARKAAAFQAYYEHMPLRRESVARGARIDLYRRFTIGDLVEINVLDTRQYGSRTEPCGYGTGPACDEVLDPRRTILGAEQERWLLRGLDRSRARWNVLAQQVPIAKLDVGAGPPVNLKLDKWDAYPVARQRLFDFLRARRVANPIVVTGDLHDNWVADLKADFDDPSSPTIGSEFIGTSISSEGDGAERSQEGEIALAENPHVRFHNFRRGYVRCDVTRRRWRTDFRVLPYVSTPGAPVSTRASFEVRDGVPGAVQVA
jgi:alkaline phosphatase D